MLEASDYAADSGTLLGNYNLPTIATGPGEITTPTQPPDICTGEATDCGIHGLLSLWGAPRFYIPYPSAYSVYYGHTNAFAGLPSILRQSSVTPVPGGLLIRTGMPIINSSEQVLLQGATGKEYLIMFPPPQPVTLTEAQP